MADISDVCEYLCNAAAAAIYPNGTSAPSVANMDVRIFQGWPNPDKLDRDAGAKTDDNPAVVTRSSGQAAQVSVFPLAGNTAIPYQILDNTYVIKEPVYGLTVDIVNDVIQISGDPTDGEYVTVVLDHAYPYSRSGATRAEIISNLVSDISVQYPGVSSTDSSITIPFQFAQIVRQGAVGIMGKVIHRQKQSIAVTVWAPTQLSRTVLASAIDIEIKKNIKISLPDTSQAIVQYSRTGVWDERQMQTIYRRELIYDVEYATVEQFPGYVITTVNTSIAKPDNVAIAHAIT